MAICAGIDRLPLLEELRREASGCRRCGLAAKRKTVVFGEGNPSAHLMLVGEGPGAEEDLQGRPFVGPAGQLLDRALAAAGVPRETVYIGNVVKCRPPGNRVPTPEEAQACLPWLRRQVEIVRPRVMLLLGATALRYLAGLEGITRHRGKWVEVWGIPALPTYHPAALLRDPAKKRPFWQDLLAALQRCRVEGHHP